VCSHINECMCGELAGRLDVPYSRVAADKVAGKAPRGPGEALPRLAPMCCSQARGFAPPHAVRMLRL